MAEHWPLMNINQENNWWQATDRIRRRWWAVIGREWERKQQSWCSDWSTRASLWQQQLHWKILADSKFICLTHRPSDMATHWMSYVKDETGCISSLWKNHLRATKRHLLHGITQCYRPTDTSENVPPSNQPSRPIHDLPTRRDGTLSWPWCWLYTEVVLPAHRQSPILVVTKTKIIHILSVYS